MENHAWIVEILNDLREYCELNKLDQLEEQLDKALCICDPLKVIVEPKLNSRSQNDQAEVIRLPYRKLRIASAHKGQQSKDRHRGN